MTSASSGPPDCTIRPSAHRTQGIDVETGVRLIEDGVLRLQHGQLQHFQALFLTARKTVVEVARKKGVVHIERIELGVDELAKLGRRKIVRPHRLSRRAHEVGDRHARYRGRVLEREEEPGLGALVGRESEDV